MKEFVDFFTHKFVTALTLAQTLIMRKEMRNFMKSKEQEHLHKQKNLNKFNSITQKVTPENQNQTHNVKKEGVQPINQKK